MGGAEKGWEGLEEDVNRLIFSLFREQHDTQGGDAAFNEGRRFEGERGSLVESRRQTALAVRPPLPAPPRHASPQCVLEMKLSLWLSHCKTFEW